MKKAVVFGAGCIGRGFIGQLLCESGYEVSFVDLDEKLLGSLNMKGSYHVQTVYNNDRADYIVGPVKGLHFTKDADKVAETLAEAELTASAVGANVLKPLAAGLSSGLSLRRKRKDAAPLNMILCENLKGAASRFRGMLNEASSPETREWMDRKLGLVDCVVGRMVPVPTQEMRSADSSFIRTEPYKELPVDRDGFKWRIPSISAMTPYDEFPALSARKLYLHNCGHAVLAYLGYLKGYAEAAEALEDSKIRAILEEAMEESVDGIQFKHNVAREWLEEHLEDLLARFANRPLADPILRLGRDPLRKLAPDDRLIGAARLALEAGRKPKKLAMGIAAALKFRPESDPSAMEMASMIDSKGLPAFLDSVCGTPADSELGRMILEAYGSLEASL